MLVRALLSAFGAAVAVFVGLLLLFVALTLVAAVTQRVASLAGSGLIQTAGTTALVVACLVVCLALAVWMARLIVDILRRDARFGVGWSRRYRLQRFARANGLTYEPVIVDPARSGVIFSAGTDRRATDVLSTGGWDPDVEIGNFQYAGDWKRERALRRFGYLRVRLPGVLPHIVLEARRNRRWFGRSNLPWQFARTQVLSLEGDFDRYFSLHTPGGYEREALYIFTPDLMALFMDRVADFDVEIVDCWMYVYSPRPFRMLDRRTYERLFAILDRIGPKTLDRAARYSRVREPRQGRPNRLIRSIPVGPLLIAALYVGLVTFRLIAGF